MRAQAQYYTYNPNLKACTLLAVTTSAPRITGKRKFIFIYIKGNVSALFVWNT